MTYCVNQMALRDPCALTLFVGASVGFFPPLSHHLSVHFFDDFFSPSTWCLSPHTSWYRHSTSLTDLQRNEHHTPKIFPIPSPPFVIRFLDPYASPRPSFSHLADLARNRIPYLPFDLFCPWSDAAPSHLQHRPSALSCYRAPSLNLILILVPVSSALDFFSGLCVS